MANAFQDMLEAFVLTKKILAVNADNASSNDTQITKLDQLDNMFHKDNRVRCFNHTLQLSAKALLKPFNVALSGPATSDDEFNEDEDQNMITLANEENDIGDEEELNEEADVEDADVKDDDIDELDKLHHNEQNKLLKETALVHEVVTKVCIQTWKLHMFRCSVLAILLV